MKNIQFREVLFKKNFFALWMGQIISEFGDRLNQMALIALIYSKNPGSAMALAKLLFFIVIPVFAIGPVAGVYVDRWDRKKVMIIADILRAILVLTIPIFVKLNLMIPVYIMVFLIFSATRFFLPSKLALIPMIVTREKLIVANSLSNTTRMIATILGFALAGYIVKLVGHMWGFYLDSLSYFMSAGCILLITVPRRLKDVKEDLQKTKEIVGKSIRRNVWSEIKEGIGYMFDHDKMKIVTSTLFLLMGGVGSIFCIIIVFIQESFGSVTEILGMLGIFLGVGMFAGTILYGKYCQHFSKIRTIFTGLTICGVMIAAFAVYVNNSPIVIVGGILIMFIGMASAPILTCTNTLIHLLVPDNVRGRIFSSMEAVMHLAFLIFMFLTAVLSKIVSNFAILLTSGIVFALAGIVGITLSRGKNLSRGKKLSE